METVDVLVVGGGPTGLTAAGDLARVGRSVAVLERRPEPNPASRAFGTMARTLEVLDARGLADDLIGRGATVSGVNLFAGARVDLTHLASRYPFVLVTPQTNVDAALTGYALAQGAVIHRGAEVVALEQDATGVTLTSRSADGEKIWRAAYVVAADGAHSTVRQLVGADFPGRAVLSSVVLADVRLTAGPAGGGLTLGSTRDEFGFLAPYGDGAWFRSMTWDRHHQVPDRAPATEAEVVGVLRRAMGRDVGVAEIGWLSRFHSEERQVTSYRHGRVLLAGDAAHVHSPMGGQGMNTGIQDAANLAWKLDAALAGADVLDTYQAERHPIGRRVLLQSGLMLRAVTLHPRPARFLRDLLAPRLLRVPAVRDAISGSFAGTTLRYGRGVVGSRAAAIPLAEGRLTVLQRTPGFVLVRGREDGEVRGAGVPQARRTDDGPAVLVRPDGYIAWSGAITDDGWRRALARWSGSGERSPHAA